VLIQYESAKENISAKHKTQRLGNPFIAQ